MNNEQEMILIQANGQWQAKIADSLSCVHTLYQNQSVDNIHENRLIIEYLYPNVYLPPDYSQLKSELTPAKTISFKLMKNIYQENILKTYKVMPKGEYLANIIKFAQMIIGKNNLNTIGQNIKELDEHVYAAYLCHWLIPYDRKYWVQEPYYMIYDDSVDKYYFYKDMMNLQSMNLGNLSFNMNYLSFMSLSNGQYFVQDQYYTNIYTAIAITQAYLFDTPKHEIYTDFLNKFQLFEIKDLLRLRSVLLEFTSYQNDKNLPSVAKQHLNRESLKLICSLLDEMMENSYKKGIIQYIKSGIQTISDAAVNNAKQNNDNLFQLNPFLHSVLVQSGFTDEIANELLNDDNMEIIIDKSGLNLLVFRNCISKAILDSHQRLQMAETHWEQLTARLAKLKELKAQGKIS